MSFTPGTRLGPYEITSAIGAGGMGELYRAVDKNLKRSVAVKVTASASTGSVSPDGKEICLYRNLHLPAIEGKSEARPHAGG